MDEKNSADNARETTRPELVQRGPVFLSDLFGVHLRSLRLTPPATSFVLNPFTTKLKMKSESAREAIFGQSSSVPL